MWTATATPCPVNARRDQSRSTRRALNKSFKDNSLHAPNTYARHRVQVKHYHPLIRKDASRAEGLRKASHSRARAPPSPSPSGTVLHARAQTRTAFSWTKTLRETILIFTYVILALQTLTQRTHIRVSRVRTRIWSGPDPRACALRDSNSRASLLLARELA